MAIPILIQFFTLYDKRIPILFTKIGRSTLAIYVFHYFLLPNVPITNYLGENLSGNLIIYWMLSILMTIPIVLTCMLLERIIKNNRYLNKMIWFQKTKA